MREMKKSIVVPKVYLETSFVSYLTGHETTDVLISTRQAYTRKWMAEEAPNCEVFISSFVVEECSRGKRELVAKRDRFLEKIRSVQVDLSAVKELAKKLIVGHALPESEVTDAFHIATAVIARMDFLLTWNCKHMANPRTLPKTMSIISASGLVCPQIMTPQTYIENIFMEGK